jgi:CBS domain-containing protein
MENFQEGAMRIERLSSVTSGRLVLIDVDATLQAAALSLSSPGIGLVVVRDGDGKAIGVLSKSDLVRHLTADNQAQASVATLMSQNIVSCNPDDEVRFAWETMIERRLQNMPVLATDGKPLGVLDIRDAMKVLFEQEEFEEHMLENYIAGVGYQ